MLGTVLVVGALILAGLALSRVSVPLVGSGIGALIAVALMGIAGCAIGGISQAQPMGWGHPMIILGGVLGVVALVVLSAGLFGWTAVLQPLGQFVPGATSNGVDTVRIAIFVLASIIAVKWVIAAGAATVAQLR